MLTKKCTHANTCMHTSDFAHAVRSASTPPDMWTKWMDRWMDGDRVVMYRCHEGQINLFRVAQWRREVILYSCF